MLQNKQKTIVNTIVEIAKKYPKRPALWVNGIYYDYSTLLDSALKISPILLEDQSTICAIYSFNHSWSYIGILAALLSNKAYMPINPAFDNEKNINMLLQSNACSIIVDETSINQIHILLSCIHQSMKVIIPFTDKIPDSLKKLKQHYFITQKDLITLGTPRFSHPQNGAYLLFTSGSTGEPKGVLVSHKNLFSYIWSAITLFKPAMEDRFLQLTEITFDLSVHDIFLCWGVGACLYSAPKKILMIPAIIQMHQITFWMSVPTVANMLSEIDYLKRESFPSLKCTVFCGEPLLQTTANAWHIAASQSKIFNLYGPTEATVGCTIYEWQKTDLDPIVKIGKVFPHQEIKIVHSELYIRGTQLVEGYWKSPKITAKKFVFLSNEDSSTNKWYKTGDLVAFDENSQLIYHGRTDDQYQIKGYRVEKIDIENSLRNATGINSIVVVPSPIDEHERVLGIAAFMLESPLSKGEIIKKIRRQVPSYMIPTAIYFLAEFPLNRNGKIDYVELKKKSKELQEITNEI